MRSSKAFTPDAANSVKDFKNATRLEWMSVFISETLPDFLVTDLKKTFQLSLS
jgi:hypothetical protein